MRESLEIMLRKVNREMASVEARLQKMAARLGARNWKELERIFMKENIDNPEVDMIWPEYLYLRERLEELKKRKREILLALKGKSN